MAVMRWTPPAVAERPAGVAQIDVVERWPRDGDRGDPDARRAPARETTAGTADAPCSARARSERPSSVGSPQARRRRPALPPPRRLAAGVVQLDVDGIAAQLRLELVGRALGDDTAAVDDRERDWPGDRPPPGSASSAGWSARPRGRGARSRPTARPAPPDRGRWSARRGRARAADGPGPSPHRACAACRPSRSGPCGRRPRSGRSCSSSASTRWRSSCAAAGRRAAPAAPGSRDPWHPDRPRSADRPRRSAAEPRRAREGHRRPRPTRVPSSGRTSVVRILTVVDLPAPFGPSKPKIDPSSTVEVEAVEGDDIGPVALDQPGRA